MLKKQIKRWLCSVLAATSIMAFGSPTMAASPDFDFYAGNTGQTYQSLTTTANAKLYVADDWSLKVDQIYFSNGVRGYGIAFVPLRAGSTAGVRQWRKYTGVTYGSYSGYNPAKTTYKLGARMDDDLSGTAQAQGYWNADYVTWNN